MVSLILLIKKNSQAKITFEKSIYFDDNLATIIKTKVHRKYLKNKIDKRHQNTSESVNYSFHASI